MSGKWFVTSNKIAGQKVYQIARLINVNEIDHAGNREYKGALFENPDQAQRMADRWNEQEGNV